jgi:TPR repeat protein
MFLTDKTAKKLSYVHYFLSQKYASNQGIEQNYRLACHHNHKAAAAGHLGAQYELGMLHFSGLGVTKNTTNAAACHKKIRHVRVWQSTISLR